MGQSVGCTVNKYIGSDFDAVIDVAEHLDEIVEVSENIEDVKTVATNIDNINHVADNLENYQIDEVITLGSNQQVVIFKKLFIPMCSFSISGQMVDGTDLFNGEDYIVENNTTIKLLRTYPEGTVLKGLQAIYDTDAPNIIIDDGSAFNRKIQPLVDGQSFTKYEEDGRLLTPRLYVNKKQYVPVNDIGSGITFASGIVTDNADGTITVSTTTGNKVFSSIDAEATTRAEQDLVTESISNIIMNTNTIPWTPNTLIEKNQSLQVFEYQNLFYLPKVNLLPFTTSDTFNADNWVLNGLVTTTSLSSLTNVNTINLSELKVVVGSDITSLLSGYLTVASTVRVVNIDVDDCIISSPLTLRSFIAINVTANKVNCTLSAGQALFSASSGVRWCKFGGVFIDSNKNATFLHAHGLDKNNNVQDFLMDGLDAFDFNLGLDALYFRNWTISSSRIYAHNGLKIGNKCVESEVVDSTIFCSDTTIAGTFGIIVGDTTSAISDYPEGMKFHNNTIAMFKTVCNIRDNLDFNMTNCWIETMTADDHLFKFEQGVSKFSNGMHLDHNTLLRGIVEFVDTTPSDSVSLIMTNTIYLESQRIKIGLGWSDLDIIGVKAKSANHTSDEQRYGVTSYGNNKNITLRDMKFDKVDDFYINLVQQLGDCTDYTVDSVDSVGITSVPFYFDGNVKCINSAAPQPLQNQALYGSSLKFIQRGVDAAAGDSIANMTGVRLHSGSLIAVELNGSCKALGVGTYLRVVSSTNGLERYLGDPENSQDIMIPESMNPLNSVTYYRVLTDTVMTISVVALNNTVQLATDFNIVIRQV